MDCGVIFNYFYWWEILLIITYLVAGFSLMVIVFKKSKWFWSILIAIVVGTSGLMIQGYCLIDEYLTGCVLIGGFLAILTKRVSTTLKDQHDTLIRFHK